MVKTEAARHFDAYFVHKFGNTDPTWPEAMVGPYSTEFIMAKLAEQNSFGEHNVFTLVERSVAFGKRIFKPKVVLKIKLLAPTPDFPLGRIDKFKYRLTIAAYTKMLKQGVDYAEKHASTVRWPSIKLLIAIAVKFNLDIVLFDIKTFFLYGELEDEVYMEQEPSWVQPDKPAKDWICRLNKSMYGLPQASHCAQKVLKETVAKGGHFTSTASDDCVFVSTDPKPESPNYVAMGTHVDDGVAVGRSGGLATMEATIGEKFTLTKKVNPTVICGVQVERDRALGQILLHQGPFAEGILVNHHMADCKGADTPMDPGTAKALMLLPIDSPADPVVVKAYQTLVGELIWLFKTRPDLKFTICLLSRFLQTATQRHLDIALNRPLRYLRKTTFYGLIFRAGQGDWVLSGKADADLAGDITTARSTLGHCLKLGEYGSIITHCKLDRRICTSTGQSETYAMQSLVKDVMWARGLLAELGLPMTDPTVLKTDNDGVLKQSTKTINHTTAKHYRIAQAYIREKCLNGTIAVHGEDTKTNEADMLTKALANSLFSPHSTTIMGPDQRSRL
jgi:hypothetical protein